MYMRDENEWFVSFGLIPQRLRAMMVFRRMN